MNPNSEMGFAQPDSIGKRIVKSAAWLFAGRIGSQGLSMLFAVLIARQLGANGLGQYAFMTSVVFLGNLGTTFGTDMLIIREMAARRDLSLLQPALAVQLLLSFPFIVIVLFVAPLIPNQSSGSIQALQLYTLVLLPLAFYSVFSSALRGVERMDSFAWLNITSGAILLVLGLIFVRPTSSALQLAAILLAAQTASAIVAGVLCFANIPNLKSALSVLNPDLRSVLLLSAPIAVLGILGALYQRMAVYLISIIDSQAATGLFSAALRLVEAAKIGHVAMLGGMFPAMSQAAIQAQVVAPKFQRTFFSSLWFLIGLAIVLAMLFSFFARPIVHLLYGSGFDASAVVLSPLGWVLVPMTISHYLSLRLLAAKREKPIMFALLLSTLLLVLLIPRFLLPAGLVTVAWVMIGAETLQAIALTVAWQKRSR